MDRGRQGDTTFTSAVLSCLSGQHSATVAARARLQLDQLPALAGAAEPVAQWMFTSLREKLVTVGARTVRHGRNVVFQLVKGAVSRSLFIAILPRIGRLTGADLGSAGAEGGPCAEGWRSPRGDLRRTPEAAFRRSRRPFKSIVEPGNRGYPG